MKFVVEYLVKIGYQLIEYIQGVPSKGSEGFQYIFQKPIFF